LEKEEEIYIGIDVSQLRLDIAAHPSGQIWQHKNTTRGIAKTVAKLKEVNPRLIVMEATGGLEKALSKALHQAELPVVVENPRRVRDFGRAMGTLAKTDKLDAKVLAYFAAKVQPAPRPVRNEASEQLESLVTRREQVSEMVTAEKNRLKQASDPAIQSHIQEHIAWLESEINDLEKELKDSIDQNPQIKEKVDLYKSMPGVGNILSYSLVANLGELGFLNQREIASLVGLAPFNRDSGRYRGKRAIWGGRARVRKAFYMPALAAIRYNEVIRNLYRRLLKQGKLKKVAIVACMHKMLTILNAMAKNNIAWNKSRVRLLEASI
jgi:transposase